MPESSTPHDHGKSLAATASARAPWTPSPGELFYAECLGRFIGQDGRPHKDRSWSQAIFRMVACDARLIVADLEHNGSGHDEPSRMSLATDRFLLHPVSPGVAEALGLAELPVDGAALPPA